MSQPAKFPVLVFLCRPLTDLEIKAVEARNFDYPLPQKPILEANLTDADVTWFRQQAFVGKVDVLPRTA
jgi:hypothetical protein